jgi:hypothetical protein
MLQNNQALLTRLHQNGVHFVIIGGVCSVYYGVPIATFDLDICCPFDEETQLRIERAVSDLHPFHRLTADKLPLELNPSLCSRLKNLYLQTDLGRLDCLSEVSGLGDYQEVIRQSQEGEMPYGKFRFLTLDGLMVAKKAAGRDRDLETLKHLNVIKETIEQKRKPQDPKGSGS